PAVGTPSPPPPEVAPVNVTALIGEAMNKSGLLWIDVPGDRAWPAWHAWASDTAYVINGPGEQTLPWLPPEVTLLLRSKDTGGRLLRVAARAEVLPADSAAYAPAVEALRASRLNAPADVEDRWRAECTVTALRPYGPLVEGPGNMPTGNHIAKPPPTPATTATWLPKHLRGRPQRRRGTH
ncbi:MAG TPA: hypothetical protein VHM65_08400, partial [Candidatus Lustribacter sp.]|nr:hypothetical protein [Candidatus Lustribacter sp.]